MEYFVIAKGYFEEGFNYRVKSFTDKDSVLDYINREEFIDDTWELLRVIKGEDLTILKKTISVPSFIEKTRFEI